MSVIRDSGQDPPNNELRYRPLNLIGFCLWQGNERITIKKKIENKMNKRKIHTLNNKERRTAYVSFS